MFVCAFRVFDRQWQDLAVQHFGKQALSICHDDAHCGPKMVKTRLHDGSSRALIDKLIRNWLQSGWHYLHGRSGLFF